MIISISACADDEVLEYKIYLCSTLDFNRLIEEIINIDLNDIIDDDGVEYTEIDPFLLRRIYLN